MVGWGDTPIEDAAATAAQATAGALAAVGVERIVSSPVARARQTAAPLAERTGLDVEVDERVGELDVGPWTGMTEAEVADRWPDDWSCWRTNPHELRVDGRAMAGTYLLVLASIGPRCGGGMRLTPGAVADDGWLDLLALDPLTMGGALARLPRLYDGRLAGDPAFRVLRCRSAWIAGDPPAGVELDGQLFGTTPVSVQLQPGAIMALDCRMAGSAER